MALQVPPAITSHIFSLIPAGIISEREPDPTIALLLFMQVCRDWWALALSTPVLWNSISVVLDSQTPKSEPRRQANFLDVTSASTQRPTQLRIKYIKAAADAYNSYLVWLNGAMMYRRDDAVEEKKRYLLAQRGRNFGTTVAPCCNCDECATHHGITSACEIKSGAKLRWSCIASHSGNFLGEYILSTTRDAD
ncbi:hypothetical protein B0H14DRAFT_2575841 [Mycena olivaceomarginata]|nr:hypothetical protein B0H14DRAFT_2575841 [Mycena olivaceomarginata]